MGGNGNKARGGWGNRYERTMWLNEREVEASKNRERTKGKRNDRTCMMETRMMSIQRK